MRHAITAADAPTRASAHAVTATPPGSRRRRGANRGDPGERDFQTHAPIDASHSATKHRSNQQRVAGDRQQLEKRLQRPAKAGLPAALALSLFDMRRTSMR